MNMSNSTAGNPQNTCKFHCVTVDEKIKIYK